MKVGLVLAAVLFIAFSSWLFWKVDDNRDDCAAVDAVAVRGQDGILCVDRDAIVERP